MANGAFAVMLSAPGPISTELVNSIVPPAMAKVIRDCTLLGELGDPEDIANLAVFLVSKRSKFITAQVIQCDGGTFDYNPVRYGLRKLSTEDQASGAAPSSLRESNN